MIDELKMDFADNNAVNFTVLPENVSNIKLSQRGIELLKYDVGTNKRFQTYIAERYDESYKGRAVILKRGSSKIYGIMCFLLYLAGKTRLLLKHEKTAI